MKNAKVQETMIIIDIFILKYKMLGVSNLSFLKNVVAQMGKSLHPNG